MAEMSKYARTIRSYEISIWTLQDRFLSVLKWATQDHKGQIQKPEMTIRDDGTQELSFVIPKFYWVGNDKIQNPMWLHLEDQPLEANMHKLKVIFNKNTDDEEVFEFLVTSVAHDHSEDRVELTVKAEGLAFHELGKIGYRVSLSQDTFTTAFNEWVENGMDGEQPEENIQFWNDLIFKNTKGKWKGNWKYEIQMDWSAYSYQNNRKTDKIYEDEYVSSWQVEDGKLSPRAIEVSKEKWRPVEVKESNLYNITQTIAEEFGVFCRYEYEHDENYQLLPEQYDEEGNVVPTRKVIYYNNFYYDVDGHIDLTYPYSSSAITRTVDNSNIVTKMYIPQVEYDDQTITIMDVEANKSKEDYLLDFEYLHNIQAITDEQYDEIEKYEAIMHTYNTTLYSIQERIRVLENQLIDVSARVTTLNNALKLDEEQESEAARLLRGVRGGSEDLPIKNNLTVMTGEGTNEDWKQYVTVTRWEGLNPESIHLYENSNTDNTFSGDISFIIRRDENGEISHLTNLGRSTDEDHQVWIVATYNPYDYYKRMIERWKTRETLDTQDLAAAELEEAKINWYLHGSRVGYGLVGGIIMGETTYPVGVTMYDEPWDTEDLSRSDRAGEMRIVGTNEEGEAWSAADPPKPDPFEDLDLTSTTPDLYYTLNYYLEEKAERFNAFEKMMGPAMREGYWQPDNYHDYGDQYHDSVTVSKVIGSLQANDPLPTTPYLEWKWDYEKYYTNETPVMYRVGVDTRPNAHLIIDIGGCLDVIREHLDDLSFIYVDPATVRTINELKEEINSLKEEAYNQAVNEAVIEGIEGATIQDTNLCWLAYDEEQNRTNYFNTVPTEENEDFKPIYTSVLPQDDEVEEDTDNTTSDQDSQSNNTSSQYGDMGIGTTPSNNGTNASDIQNAAADDGTSSNNDSETTSDSEDNTSEDTEDMTLLNDTEDKRLKLLEDYEEIDTAAKKLAIEYRYADSTDEIKPYVFYTMSLDLDNINTYLDELTSLKTLYSNIITFEQNPIVIDKSAERVKWCNDQIALIQQVYDCIAEYIYTPLSRANQWIPISISTLETNKYNIYQIGADCELGWVRIAAPIQGDDEGHDEKIIDYTEPQYLPALFITGASNLSDDELNYIMTGWYPQEQLNVTEEEYEYEYTFLGREYAPFLGLYNVDVVDTLDEDGEILNTQAQIAVEKLYQLSWPSKQEAPSYVEALGKVSNQFIDGLRRSGENYPSLDECLTSGKYPSLKKEDITWKNKKWEMEDYDGIGIKRWMEDEEYAVRRVFPRFYFPTLKLKNNSNDLKILLNDVLLENNTDYYTVQDDRSVGMKVQGIGYYTTLKPEVLYKLVSDRGLFKIVYTISNVDTAIYLDALKVMHENATPKISYDVELSVLNPDFIHTAYNRLNQIVYINDNDLKLDDVSGYISSVTMQLDRPWEDQVEVKNYATKFEDLFSTIVAQTEAMKKSQGGITAALQAFSTNGLIDSNVLQDSLFNSDLNLNFDSGDGELNISKEGIIGTSSSGIVAFRGGGIFTATTKDSNGNWMWNTGILPSGINANLITTGQLNTNLIKIYAGDEIRFQLNGDGLFAYKPFVVADTYMAKAMAEKNYTAPENGIDSSQYVVYNSDGLALIARQGTWYKVPNSHIDELGRAKDPVYEQTTDEEIKRVEISWNGLILRNWQNEQVFYADPDTGNLTLKGQIVATSGQIAGWNIKEDGLDASYIKIRSDSTGAGIYLTNSSDEAGDKQLVYYVETIENESTVTRYIPDGIVFYGYRYKNSEGDQVVCYYKLSEDTQSAPLSFKYNNTVELFNIVTAAIGVIPKYTILDENGTYYITDEELTEITYENNPIAYTNDYQTISEDPAWYTDLKLARPDEYNNYVNLKYDTVAVQINNANINSGTILTLIGSEPTFQVKAIDGETVINKGNFGTLYTAGDGIMGGVLTNIELSLDNFATVERAESTQPDKMEKVELGRCFYDSKFDKATGKLILIRLDGTTVEYKIASSSSSSSSCGTTCTSSCNQNCATGCATQCGQQCASSCAGLCKGTSKNAGGCFVGDTLVTILDNKYKPIKDLTVGDDILTYDENTGINISSKVIMIQKLKVNQIVELQFSNNIKILTTVSHPFLTNHGWASLNPEYALREHKIKTTYLVEGDQLLTAHKEMVYLNKITIYNYDDPIDVYNLATEKYHTFFVEDIIVHNTNSIK